MSVGNVQDKLGKEILEGDFVFTKFRGGSHEGKVGFSLHRWPVYRPCWNPMTQIDHQQVELIVKDEETARREGLSTYPKARPDLAMQG
jgi:hypothetical protein